MIIYTYIYINKYLYVVSSCERARDRRVSIAGSISEVFGKSSGCLSGSVSVTDYDT